MYIQCMYLLSLVSLNLQFYEHKKNVPSMMMNNSHDMVVINKAGAKQKVQVGIPAVRSKSSVSAL